jgi:DNA-binding protein H-NS
VIDDIKALQAEKLAIESKLAEARKASRESAIKAIMDIMTDNDLSGADLGFTKTAGAPRKPRGAPVQAKYRSPDGTSTWAGRGKRPGWFSAALAAGLSADSMLIQAESLSDGTKAPGAILAPFSCAAPKIPLQAASKNSATGSRASGRRAIIASPVGGLGPGTIARSRSRIGQRKVRRTAAVADAVQRPGSHSYPGRGGRRRKCQGFGVGRLPRGIGGMPSLASARRTVAGWTPNWVPAAAGVQPVAMTRCAARIESGCWSAVISKIPL